MRSILNYMLDLRAVLGSSFGLALAVGYLLWEVLFLLYGKRKKLHPVWIYVGSGVIALILPVVYVFGRLIHADGEQLQLCYLFLPALLLGAVALTGWKKDLQMYFGKWTLPVLLVATVLMVGQPWNYQTKGIFYQGPIVSAKVDDEIVTVANLMDEGTVVLPQQVGEQLSKVQQQTRMEYEGADWFTTGEDIVAIFQYVKKHPVRYVVLEKADYNDSYMELVEYQRLGETEHYDIYMNPSFDL